MKTIEDVGRGIAAGEYSAVEVIQKYLDVIDKREGKINAFITLQGEEALEAGKRIDEKIKKGEKVGRLAGVPVAIKDNISTEGILTTCASKILKDYIPPFDATVVKNLKMEDAIIIGKTNMDEFAMGSSNENSAFVATSNPWDIKRVPGGSSGGSAAAVAAEMVPLSLGSDTGGSIRQPAAFCGVVGIKPTYGLVSRYGLIAFASSLDQIGPMGNTVRDCALALEILQGNDPLDATSIQGRGKDYLPEINKGVKDFKIAVPKEYFDTRGLDKEIAAGVMAAVDKLASCGGKIEEVSLEISQENLAAYYLISSAEASSNLARFDGIRYGHRSKEYDRLEELIENTRSEAFGKEVKRRIMMGTYALSSGYYDAYYQQAQKLRRVISQQFREIFSSYDLIIGPTTPVLPFLKGEKVNDPLEMYLGDIYTISVNLAKLPALSMPCGFSKEGLPIGVQLIGNYYREDLIFRAAQALEEELSLRGGSRNGI